MAREDRSLLVQLRQREPEACEAFVDTHYRGVYGFFLWLTNNPDAAADLTQETFTGFWASTPRLDPARAPDLKAWLYGIARNRWRKRCRAARSAGEREGRSLEEASDLPDGAPGPEDAVLASLQSAAVVHAVSDLPVDYREALVLRVFQELSYAQIAEALGIGEGLARWRVHQARARLRKALSQALEDEVRQELREGEALVSTWRDEEEERWSPFDAALRQTRRDDPDPALRGRCLPPRGSGMGPAGSEIRILVVDDEPNIRRLIEHHLLHRGYQVELCSNGPDALRQLRERRPDLVILDVMMPEMDGFEVLARMKEDPATGEIPVLMLTARGTDDDIRHGWGIGAEWYMTKPFNPEELCFLLARMTTTLDAPDSPPPLRRWLK